MEDKVVVTPGEVLGKVTELKPGKGAYVEPKSTAVYASLSGRLSLIPPVPDSPDQRPTVEVIGHKAHGAVPEPGSIVLARVTKVMARMASADIMCVGTKSVREKFSGIIRQQDVRATEIDKVEMHSCFRPGDIVKALVLSLGDARAYYLSTAKNELGVVSAESTAGGAILQLMLIENKRRQTQSLSHIHPRQQVQQWFRLVGLRCNAHPLARSSRERLPRLDLDKM